jgi:hypothetical protein
MEEWKKEERNKYKEIWKERKKRERNVSKYESKDRRDK